jgi:2-polyprenyl-3-methyl-5-hydroxy-6-metoxy-1,4-benzoquinol methylase
MSNRSIETPTVEDIIKRNVLLKRGWDDSGKPRALNAQEFFEISCELRLNQNNPQYRNLFDNLAHWITRNTPTETALEIGAGPGYLIYRLNSLGINTIGVDGNEFSRSFFLSQHPSHKHSYIIDPEFKLNYMNSDTVIAIESFEHMDDDSISRIMEKIRNQVCPKFIIFSSTPYLDPNPGWDTQWGHINIKPPLEWDTLFADNGYHRVALSPPVTPWAVTYASSEGLSWLGNKAAKRRHRIYSWILYEPKIALHKVSDLISGLTTKERQENFKH